MQSIPVESNISGRRRKKRYVRKSIFAMYPTVSLPFFNHNSSLAPTLSRQSPATGTHGCHAPFSGGVTKLSLDFDAQNAHMALKLSPSAAA
ncbi:hypothetical protein [Rhizobium sp. NFACC06-2]|uniref:hypothetical protein n=1 Tax=Rhizobium sp. NFACC06-2 TaxID=1566264 RepID=UPI00165F3EB1|nr:hypothetical protein [Rhizobium sp. NFACC06-2]